MSCRQASDQKTLTHRWVVSEAEDGVFGGRVWRMCWRRMKGRAREAADTLSSIHPVLGVRWSPFSFWSLSFSHREVRHRLPWPQRRQPLYFTHMSSSVLTWKPITELSSDTRRNYDNSDIFTFLFLPPIINRSSFFPIDYIFHVSGFFCFFFVVRRRRE